LLYDSDFSRSEEEVAAAGQAYFDSTYGDTAAKVQPMLRSVYPDLGAFVIYPFASAPEFDLLRTLHDKTWVWACVCLLGGDLGEGDVIFYDICSHRK
jgi:hypothetical protein